MQSSRANASDAASPTTEQVSEYIQHMRHRQSPPPNSTSSDANRDPASEQPVKYPAESLQSRPMSDEQRRDLGRERGTLADEEQARKTFEERGWLPAIAGVS